VRIRRSARDVLREYLVPMPQTLGKNIVRGSADDRARGARPAPQAALQPSFFSIRFVEAGCFARSRTARVGRGLSAPLQLGQCFFSTPCAQSAQNVHSKEQIRASGESGGRSASQHSQFGRISNIVISNRFGPAQSGAGMVGSCYSPQPKALPTQHNPVCETRLLFLQE
jgi:hypothetical protein